jgi:HPt (histidine-containing phosphotransfer) domain-containing protein
MRMAVPLTDGLSQEVQAKFLVLQHRFAAGLASRWWEIRDASDGPSLQAALHRLAGGAASFGFGRIGQCARDAELLAMNGSSAALEQALALLESEIGLAQR